MTWQCDFDLPNPDATEDLARRIAPHLGAGDCILLEGEIGAGKSTFARALLTARLAQKGRIEDIPSPTFTLVQVYDLGDVEAWHFDLYRLGSPDDAIELGLDEALETAICLIEWPDRLGSETPRTALTIHLSMTPAEGRHITVSTHSPDRWAGVLPLFEASA